jgi:hypothetical protein
MVEQAGLLVASAAGGEGGSIPFAGGEGGKARVRRGGWGGAGRGGRGEEECPSRARPSRRTAGCAGGRRARSPARARFAAAARAPHPPRARAPARAHRPTGLARAPPARAGDSPASRGKVRMKVLCVAHRLGRRARGGAGKAQRE